MGLAIPHIVEKLPEHRERILKARFRSAVVDDLCRDYDTVAQALSETCRLDGYDSDVEQELLQLAGQLEEEMLSWLVSHPDLRP